MFRTYPQLLIFILMTFGYVSSTQGQSQLLSSEEIQEDISVYVKALKECHPGLSLHLTAHELDELFKDLQSNSAEIEIADFFKILKRTTTGIQDAHTDLYPGELLRKRECHFPLQVKILEEKIFAKISNEPSTIQKYHEIISINGIESSEVLKEIFTMTPADGNHLNFKEEFTERAFSMQYANLIECAQYFEVAFLVNEADTLIKVYSQGPCEELPSLPPLDFELFASEGYALLTVNTFDYNSITRADIDFHKFLKQSFKQLRKKNIDHLIVDVRENYGGHNILGLSLYSYLTKGSLNGMNPSKTLLSGTNGVSEYSNFPKGEYPFEVHPLNDNEADLSFMVRKEIDAQDTFDSNYIYRGPDKKKEKIARNKYSGNIYCLTSGMTFSAGANFVSFLSREKNAIFIGQETGGANGKYCGGGFYNVTLPHSQIVLSIPFMQRCVVGFEDEDPEIRVVPDYKIEKSLLDKDLELEFAKELIKNIADE